MTTGWAKSSLSAEQYHCVEVMIFDDGSADVRNSRRHEEGTLHFTPDEWEAFIGGVMKGEFSRKPRPPREMPDLLKTGTI